MNPKETNGYNPTQEETHNANKKRYDKTNRNTKPNIPDIEQLARNSRIESKYTGTHQNAKAYMQVADIAQIYKSRSEGFTESSFLEFESLVLSCTSKSEGGFALRRSVNKGGLSPCSTSSQRFMLIHVVVADELARIGCNVELPEVSQ